MVTCPWSASVDPPDLRCQAWLRLYRASLTVVSERFVCFPCFLSWEVRAVLATSGDLHYALPAENNVRGSGLLRARQAAIAFRRSKQAP